MGKLKILIAEDDNATTLLYRIAFRNQRDAELLLVSDGDEALTRYKSWHPDIVVLDFVMPKVSGLEALETIRDILNDTTTTVIMVSSVKDKKQVTGCIKLGIQGYILKPFSGKNIAMDILDIHQKKNLPG